MRIGYGNGGWVRVDGIGLPGQVYARFAQGTDRRWRITELYVDGEGEPLPLAAIRQLPIDALEAAMLEGPESVESRSNVAGPDLHRLAAHYATTWGSGTYSGRHCSSCGGPVRGRAHEGPEKSLSNWVAESWFAQFAESGVRQASMPQAPEPPAAEADDFPVLDPPQGSRITDDFLVRIRSAYALCLRRGLPPAPTIAELTAVSPRTVHKWVYTARARGIMPPGQRGRAG
ncbi:hypothetical protein [Amycolatopsis sp. NPDC003861]